MEFTKKDLKDGMVVTYNTKDKRTFLQDGLYEKSEDNEYVKTLPIESLMYDLSFGDIGCRIIKVEYMGETIWERKEYVDFMTAINSGKRIKHKDWSMFHEWDSSLLMLKGKDKSKELSRINSNEWEIER